MSLQDLISATEGTMSTDDGEKIEDGQIHHHDKLDLILEQLGNFGRYQLWNSVLLIFPILFSASFTAGYIFTAAQPDYRCKVAECETNPTNFDPPWLEHAFPLKEDKMDKCKKFQFVSISNDTKEHPTCTNESFDSAVILKCKNWVYSDQNTIVSEFDIGCDTWKRTIVGSLNSFGQLVCMPISGILSDKFGRRTLMIMGTLSSCILGITKALAPNYWIFATLEFLERVFGAGVFAAGFILAVELVAPKNRLLSSTFISCAYALGEVFIGLLAWQFHYWRTLLLVTSIPAGLVFFYFWIVPESVRWLLNQGKFDRAGKVLKTAAKWNGKELSEKSLEDLYDDYKKNPYEENDVEKSTMIGIFKSKILLVRLIFCSSWWITCTFVYYGLSINSVSIVGNMYLNFVLVSASELPGHITYLLTVNIVGRKYTICWAFLASGVSCIAFIFIPETILWVKLAVYFLGKYSITVAFTTLYVYTSELFPTPQRNSMMGFCSMIGRIGSIIAPQTPLLTAIMESLPQYLFGGISIISGLTILAFPETNKTRLPDTIEEAEELGRQRKVK